MPASRKGRSLGSVVSLKTPNTTTTKIAPRAIASSNRSPTTVPSRVRLLASVRLESRTTFSISPARAGSTLLPM